jgi:hypothetical protein
VERRLLVQLDEAFARGANCSVGAKLQIPIQIRSADISRCTIRVSAEAEVIHATTREVELLGSDQRQRVVVGVVAQRPTEGPAWIRVRFEIEETPVQELGFFLTVSS